MSTTKQTFQQGDGCCQCNCTGGDGDCGSCLLTLCCPCYSFCQAAEKLEKDSGTCHFIATLFGCGCCSLMNLGQKVEEKRGLKSHGFCWHCCHSTCDGCTCHSCRVVNECNVYEKEGAVGSAPTAVEMQRQ